jgi:hypothetical protein
MGEPESKRLMNQKPLQRSQTLGSLPFSSEEAKNRAQSLLRNLYDCPISGQTCQGKLNVCTVSKKAMYATYLYVFGQKLTERPQKVRLHD